MRRLACVLLALLAGCHARPLELSVDVRTDLVPGADFASVRVELLSDRALVSDSAEHPASPSDAFAQGVRIADFVVVAPGPSRVRAVLLDASGAEVVARRVDLVLERDYALTIVLSAGCVGRACPASGEPASFGECLSGRCIDAHCGGPRPSGCGDLGCATGSECAGRLGCIAACIEGACVCAGPLDAGHDDAGPADSGPHDAGPDDAGPCPGECSPGAGDEETRACGECGEGLERRSRTCGEDCRWGSFSSFGACTTSAQCSPGQTDRETRACGNCNLGSQSRSRSCTGACTWGAFSGWTTCSGGGTCAPGATRTGCDPCGHQVCTTSCTWGSCQPAPGNACLRIRPGTTGPEGNNYRCCGSSRWQFCLDTCQWSTTCASCSGCC